MSAEVRRPQILVDLGAIRRNVGILRDLVAGASSDVMVVVKADGYGHGMVEAAQAARDARAPWLGVATIEEALHLRAAGDTGRLLCWLTVPGDDWAAAIDRGVDVTAYTVAELDEIRAAVTGTPARLQLKIDTGLSRGGSTADDWPDLVAAARAGEADGTWTVTGIWSHFACSDEPEHPSNDVQERAFRDALAGAERACLVAAATGTPVRHGSELGALGGVARDVLAGDRVEPRFSEGEAQLVDALVATGWSKAAAARRLRVSRQRLYERLAALNGRHGIDVDLPQTRVELALEVWAVRMAELVD